MSWKGMSWRRAALMSRITHARQGDVAEEEVGDSSHTVWMPGLAQIGA